MGECFHPQTTLFSACTPNFILFLNPLLSPPPAHHLRSTRLSIIFLPHHPFKSCCAWLTICQLSPKKHQQQHSKHYLSPPALLYTLPFPLPTTHKFLLMFPFLALRQFFSLPFTQNLIFIPEIHFHLSEIAHVRN
jgi:hypothetical protein